MEILFEKEDIKKILPHREPFLFVDAILELKPGLYAKGLKKVEESEFYFQGHFPKFPVMPGVLIVESIAQVGAVCVLTLEEFKGNVPFFSGIDKCRFKRKVTPGDTMLIEVELLRLMKSSRFGKGKGKVFVTNELVAEGEFLFSIS